MISIRQADDRGHTKLGWLDSKHSFSFGEYFDRRNMGFRALRVINEDKVRPGAGFGTHPHQDMEIISYVLDGELSHKDSMGNGSVIKPGDVQRMSAGTGVLHSEHNPSPTQPVHFLQIWILPEREGIEPSYEQKAFSAQERQGRLRLVASQDGREGSVQVHQDMQLFAGLLGAGESTSYRLQRGRNAWVQVARGSVAINGKRLGAGDGAAIAEEDQLELLATEPSEVLLFDLA